MKTLKEHLTESTIDSNILLGLSANFSYPSILHHFDKVWKDERSVDNFFRNYKKEKDKSIVLKFIKSSKEHLSKISQDLPSVMDMNDYRENRDTKELVDNLYKFLERQLYIAKGVSHTVIPYSYTADELDDADELLDKLSRNIRKNDIQESIYNILSLANIMTDIWEDLEVLD